MEYPFLTAVKQAFDQAAGKSGGTVFWRLDAYVKGKAQLVHNNSLIGDAGQSWKLLETNLTNQYRWGGVRQFDIYFRESNNDAHPKLFPLDLTSEAAVNAMAGKQSVGIAGIGSMPGLELLGINGLGGILQLIEGKHAAELARREQELIHKHDMEKLLLEIRNGKDGSARIGEAIERLLDKPGFGEKLLDKLFPEAPAQVAGGSAASDNAAAADDGFDFNPLIEGKLREFGAEAANWGLDYNKSIEAMLILKKVPGVSDPGQLLKGVAEFVQSNPAMAMQMFQEIQNQQQTATA
jgi:hypothetical protein